MKKNAMFLSMKIALRILLLFALISSLIYFPQGVQAQGLSFPAEINKEFSPISITAGGISRLSVTIFNPNAFQLTNAAWADNLIGVQSGISIANPVNLTNTCGGTVIAPAGGTSLSLSGGSVPPQVGITPGSCTVSIDVTATTPGNLINTIPAGGLTGTGGGGTITNTTPASATLRVGAILPPEIDKSFNPNTMWVGEVSRLTIAISNTDPGTALTQASLTDNFPANVILANPVTPTLTGCGPSASLAAVIGTGSITLSNATIAANSTCFVMVNVTSTVSGSYINTIPANTLQNAQGATNTSPAEAPLNVQGIGLEKDFSPEGFQAGSTTTLTITLQNPTSSPLTGVNVSDVLPGTVLTVVPGSATTTCGGTASTTLPRTVSLTGGTVPAGSTNNPGTCVITVQVTSPTGAFPNTFDNTIPVGAVTTTQGITNVLPATAPVYIYSFGGGVNAFKSFTPPTIEPGGNSLLTIYVTAPVDTALTNFSIVDNLPANVVVSNSSPATASSECGASAVLTAVTGATTVTLTGGTIPAEATCQIEVYVTSTLAGSYTNTINPGDITNNEGRSTTYSPSATLTVLALSNFFVEKDFTPDTVAPNGISTLTITLRNENTSQLINVSLLDTLPGSLVNGVLVAPTPNVFTNCGSGVITATPGGKTVSMTGGTIPPQVAGVPGICTIRVDVQGVGVASIRNNLIPTSNVTATIDGTATTINPMEDANAPLEITNLSIGVVKGFNPLTVFSGSASTMSVQLVNPNNADLVGITFTDTMPAGMIVANPVNPSVGTCGGAITAAPGNGLFTFSGGSLPPFGSCTLTLNITMTVNGNLTNVIAAGAVTTSNGASNPDPAEASLTNLPGAVVSKAFSPNPINVGDYSLLTITIQNTGNIPLTGMGLSDTLPGTLPAGLEIAGALAPAPVNNCGGSLTAVAGTQSIQLTGGSVAASSSCTIVVAVTSDTAGSYQNIIPAGNLSSTEGATNNVPATDTLVVLDAVTASLGDFVWNDLDADGVQDGGEAGIDGVTVNLYAGDGTFIGTTTTAGGGLYLFDNLTPGDYYVEFIPPLGYTISPQDQGGDTTDSDANPTTGQTITTTLTAGENDLTWDAGLHQLDLNGLTKLLSGTNSSFTDGSEVAIGEILTYQVSVVFPQGQFDNAQLVDTLDRGLAFAGCDTINAPGLTTDIAGSFAGICANPTTDDAGGGTPMDVDRRVSYDFGTLTNNSQSDVTVTVTYRVIVLDIAANVDGVSLNNTALWSWTGGSLGPAQTEVTLVEPDLQIDKTSNVTAISNGAEVTFTLTISHTSASNTDALDVIVTDILPTGLEFVAGSLNCLGGAQDPDVECVFDDTNPLQPTIRAEWSVFTLGGGDSQISFRVVGNSSIPASGNVTNVANVEWTSMPGDRTTPISFSDPANQYATERYYDPGDPINLYGTNDSLTLTRQGGGGGGGGTTPPTPVPAVGGFLIPVTGFAPDIVTDMSQTPSAKYANTSIALDIPSLSVNIPIVGVPKQAGTWNVSWLGNQAGWLEGSAFPSWNGNSVLTSHVYNSNGKPGPFAKLHELKTGDQVIVHAFGQKYTFEVQTNAIVAPTDRSVMRHEERPWLTLVTCTDYDFETGAYHNRFIVRAVLVKVSADK